jgi:hypothetical protein
MPEKTKQYYAHSLEGKPPSEWHKLEEHLIREGLIEVESCRHEI